MRSQYASPSVLNMLQRNLTPLDVPILAVAAGLERPHGETATKLQGWRRHTTAGFKLATVEGGDHFTMMQPLVGKGTLAATPLYTLLLADMLGVSEGAIDAALMTKTMRDVNMEQVRKNREQAALAKSKQAQNEPPSESQAHPQPLQQEVAGGAPVLGEEGAAVVSVT